MAEAEIIDAVRAPVGKQGGGRAVVTTVERLRND
jgi:hypothetical protein